MYGECDDVYGSVLELVMVLRVINGGVVVVVVVVGDLVAVSCVVWLAKVMVLTGHLLAVLVMVLCGGNDGGDRDLTAVARKVMLVVVML